jgi:hypothetical protein
MLPSLSPSEEAQVRFAFDAKDVTDFVCLHLPGSFPRLSLIFDFVLVECVLSGHLYSIVVFLT